MHTTLINAETPISSSAVIVWVWVVAHTYEQWSWYQLVTVKQSLWLKWYKQIWQCVLIYSSFNSTRCCLQLLLMWRACKHLDQYRENNTSQIVNIGQLDKSFHWSLSVLNDGKLILNWWRLDKLHVYLIKKNPCFICNQQPHLKSLVRFGFVTRYLHANNFVSKMDSWQVWCSKFNLILFGQESLECRRMTLVQEWPCECCK